ncbi:MAG: HD domain-containing protein [bacterium]
MNDPGRRTISQLRADCRGISLAARLRGQVDELTKKESSNGKPYWEMKIRDAGDVLTLRAWSDSDAFASCENLARGECVEVEGEFVVSGSFGLDARRWRLRPLNPQETAELFSGGEEDMAALENDFSDVAELVRTMRDPRLRGLSELFLQEFGPRFRRASAARHNHHAHRGGLLRHTGQMMRSASAVCGAYPVLNRDLLLAGVLFHDCGKLWEMCPPEAGFEIPRELRGELLGHISIGIEAVNALWRKLPLESWRGIEPASEDVRLHLLHLIASHHGELQFGSPVEPKTPEAIALNMVDNLDAKLEMLAMAYTRQPEIAPGIHERVKALNASPVKPLPAFSAGDQESQPVDQ